MNSEKYIGLDVHQATICVAVMDPKGKVIMESILETKAHAQHKGAPNAEFFNSHRRLHSLRNGRQIDETDKPRRSWRSSE